MVERKSEVGKRLKELREQEDLSLEQLAKRSGISMSNLEKLENEETTVPLGDIITLAREFEVPVGELFGDRGDSPFTIVKNKEREEIMRAVEGENSYSYAGLGQFKRNRQMEPFHITLQPHQRHTIEANQHFGEEFIYVLEGKIQVSLLDVTDILEKGDSIYYDSNIPHIITCCSDEPASLLAVLYTKEETIIL